VGHEIGVGYGEGEVEAVGVELGDARGGDYDAFFGELRGEFQHVEGVEEGGAGGYG